MPAMRTPSCKEFHKHNRSALCQSLIFIHVIIILQFTIATTINMKIFDEFKRHISLILTFRYLIQEFI